MNRSLPVLLIAFMLTACKHPTSTSVPNLVDPATAGTVTGTVTFTGPPPTRIPIDMSMDPACALSTEPNLTEQTMVDHGKLANVFIYVKMGIPASSAPANTPAVVLDQKGCRYTPHVVAVQQGGKVEFHNSDPTVHNIHTTPDNGTPTVDISQAPMGPAQTETFQTPESMLPVRCNNHPWMQAFINVSPNPYYAVTKSDGSFSLPNLPPGTYTLAAVHEKLGEQDLQITVSPKATAQASFTFTAK